mgnify:CR=1 FL=1
MVLTPPFFLKILNDMDVNQVYQTVLYILNKEQRGYLTPSEFNSVATQVQLEIFEKYFEDLNQQMRRPDVVDSEYANRVKMIQEKIALFEEKASLQTGYKLPLNLHRFGTIQYESANMQSVECEELSQHEFNLISRSKLTQASTTWPVFTRRGNNLQVYPTLIGADKLFCYYIRKPNDVRWGFTVGTLGQYIYDPTPGFAGLVASSSLFTSITQNVTSATNGSYSVTIGTPEATNSGLGYGAIIDITVASGAVNAIAVNAVTVGLGFKPGDVITIPKAVLGAGTTADLLITLTAADINSASSEYSIQFELSDIDQTEVILKILAYSGVIVRDTNMIQTATQLAQSEDVIETT